MNVAHGYSNQFIRTSVISSVDSIRCHSDGFELQDVFGEWTQGPRWKR